MKSIITIILLLFLAAASAQESTIDSALIWTTFPHKPKVVETVYGPERFQIKLDSLSNIYKTDTFIIQMYMSNGTKTAIPLKKRKVKKTLQSI